MSKETAHSKLQVFVYFLALFIALPLVLVLVATTAHADSIPTTTTQPTTTSALTNGPKDGPLPDAAISPLMITGAMAAAGLTAIAAGIVYDKRAVKKANAVEEYD